MDYSARSLRRKNTSKPKENRLFFEKLESRVLMAMDTIESSLSQLASPNLFNAPAIVGTLPTVGNTPPAVARPIALTSGTVVTTRSMVANVLGRDDKPEQNLRYTWQTVNSPAGGTVTFAVNGTNAAKQNTLTFNRAGSYTIRVNIRDAEGLQTTNTLQFTVRQTLSRVALTTSTNQAVSSSTPVVVSGTNQRLNVRGFDQFGAAMAVPTLTFRTTSVPTNGSARLTAQSGGALVTFTRPGAYVGTIQAESIQSTVRFTVPQTLTRIQVAPNTTPLSSGQTRQYQATGYDQFGTTMSSAPRFTWSATGGTISTTGLYRAGATPGAFSITATASERSASTAVTVAAASSTSTLRDPQIVARLNTYYSDRQITRQEMMALIRSAGDDGTVSANELADLRHIISSQASYTMPVHVRELAKDVLNSSPANSTFRGQALGNLAAGSNAAHLNNLVDKWFLGADLPVLTSGSISYRNAVGSLFSSAPSMNDARQGALGDCYFIATLASIAAKNVDAIRNMFIDNGDNTFTVRFFSGALGYRSNNGLLTAGFVSGTGVADYITVNRQLPTYSNGSLAYSGSGLSASSTSTPLWIALAEKAYAQWNQTGNAGRDGTNRFASIEGGWMSNTNAQVLGYNSTNHVTSSSSKETLINAITANHAVTIGTTTSPNAGGLVGGHAYIVTGYNASTDRFTLFNPWGVSHPSPLSWAQLQSNTSMFVVANPSGSTQSSAPTIRSSVTEIALGNWTTVVMTEVDNTIDGEQTLITESETLIAQSNAASFITDEEFLVQESYILVESIDAAANINMVSLEASTCCWHIDSLMV